MATTRENPGKVGDTPEAVKEEYDPEATLPGMDSSANAALDSLQRTQSQTKMRISEIERLIKQRKSDRPK